jgi:hypothetical protein
VEADRVRVYVLAGVPDWGGVGGVFVPQESMDRISAISMVAAMAVLGVTCLLNFCLVVVWGLAAGLWWLVCRRAQINWDVRRRWGDGISGVGIVKILVESAIDRTARRIGNVVTGSVGGNVCVGGVVGAIPGGVWGGWGVGGLTRLAETVRAVVVTCTWKGAVALAVSVTGVGITVHVAPAGAPVQVRVTRPAKPSMDCRASW